MLSKSYLDKTDRSRSPPQDRVLYDLFKRVYKQGRITEFVNLQTGERVDNGYILQQSDKYAKGLLSLDTLETGADCILMVGCYSLEALAVWVACLSIGISVVPKLVFLPREKMIESIVAMAKPKVILVGDAADGEIVKALLSLIHSNSENPSSEKLRGVEHVFYEGVNNSHLQNYPFIKSLDDMIQQGQSIEDQELERIRCTVQPEHITQMVFSTGTTGECKGSLHTHRSFLEHIGKPGFISNGHVCLTENINRSGFVALTRTAFNLAGKTDKLVFSSDVSKNTTGEGVAKISGDSIIDERVTIVVLLPMDLDKLCEYMADTYPNAKQVRSTLLFGQVYTKKFKQKVEESLGGKTVTIYGLSEIPKVGVSPIGSSESDEKDRLEARLILSDGGVMRIVDENDCIVDTETAGRIQLKSRYIFKEYKDLINVTEQAFTEDGFYKTNDIGIMYPDGKFSIIGRESLRTCLYVRRFKLMPSPIEDIVSTHKSIRDVKVVSGTRTADTGDEIVYCIRTEKGSQDLSWQEVIQHCKEKQMMELKFPKRILFFDEFPQTKNGRKTDVNFLKELVLQRISVNPEEGIVPAGSYTQ